MSTSLTYLVGVLVFAVLFAALTMREENAWAAGKNGKTSAAATQGANGERAAAEAAK
jgi:hypothetical protein